MSKKINLTLTEFKPFFSPYFQVDSRILGLFRMIFGLLCFVDIFRRWNFIEPFYSGHALNPIKNVTSIWSPKSFNILNSFSKVWELEIIFLIGMLFSIFLIIGYRTKLSQIVTAIIIISIHNRALIVENAGDMVLNNLLVLSVFLPLGLSLSVDSLKRTLQTIPESTPEHLNNPIKNNYIQIFNIAFFALLLQVTYVYFFSGLNKSGADWMSGTAVHYMYQLDTFLTPLGYFVRDFISLPVSEILTYMTLAIEFSAPILIFSPIFNRYTRLLFIFLFCGFHLTIAASLWIGLFSFTMMSTYVLLISTRDIDFLRNILKKYYKNSLTIFYDADCGFCHYTSRIIKRLDVLNVFTWAGAHSTIKKPSVYESLKDKTIMVYEPDTEKCYTKEKAFGKILLNLPFGFLIGWIFFIPGLSYLFEKIYDFIANNRTQTSILLGLPACDLKSPEHVTLIPQHKPYRKYISFTSKVFSSITVCILIIAMTSYALVANKEVNKIMERNGYEKFKYNNNLKKISTYFRTTQKWDMFSASVKKSDAWTIVSATLNDGTVIDPFTGETPILDRIDYEILWKGTGQFWRKFLTRIAKHKNSKYVNNFSKWLKRRNNNYFNTLDGRKINTVTLYHLTQKNAAPNQNQDDIKIYKRVLNQSSGTSKKTKFKK